MKYLVFTDPHLTDNPREEYRWRCFDYARLLTTFEKIDRFAILGDLTDKKDGHSSTLVNRMVKEISFLAQFAPVEVLKGNHDYRDPSQPYFEFLGKLPNVTYYKDPTNISDMDGPYMWLPHTFKPKEDWAFVDFAARRKAVFMHQTISRARLSNGMQIEGGVTVDWFNGTRCLVLSGDVHVPQRVGRVLYVGSPHPVHFGDEFSPRMVILDGKKVTPKPVKTIRRCHAQVRTAKELRKHGLSEGDHLKVTVSLERADIPRWPKIRDGVRKVADSLKVELFGVTAKLPRERVRLERTAERSKDVFARYCVAKKLTGNHIEAGEEIMSGVDV